MKRNTEISHIQTTLRSFDLDSCKFIAIWLSDYINILEIDINTLNKTIRDLDLSKRAYNVLKTNGIDTIQQLLVISANWDNIRILKGAGDIVTNEIQEKITEFQDEHKRA